MNLEHEINNWSRSTSDKTNYLEVYAQIQYLADSLFHEFEPTKGAGFPPFMDRLERTLKSGLTKKQQKTIFKLIPKLCFVGKNEFNTLYSAAYNGPIARWLIERYALSILDPNIQIKLKKAIEKTWFCPITDSLKISEFYHVNSISGPDLRSDWRTLHELGDKTKLGDYLKSNHIENLVLLEDFVGSGSQVYKSVEFAATISSSLNVLFCPLICCKTGIKTFSEYERTQHNFSFRTILEVPTTITVTSVKQMNEPHYFDELRKLFVELYHKVAGNVPTQKLYGPFGYRDTGSLLIMHTNCPDNCPPIIHHYSDQWSPVFPRSSRL